EPQRRRSFESAQAVLRGNADVELPVADRRSLRAEFDRARAAFELRAVRRVPDANQRIGIPLRATIGRGRARAREILGALLRDVFPIAEALPVFVERLAGVRALRGIRNRIGRLR